MTEAMPAGARIGPSEQARRVEDVDALRGFALLGILIVNLTFMSSGYPGNLVTDPAFSSTLDDLVRSLSSVFVDMKFYILFSFLFGYSFTLQMQSADRSGSAFKPRMRRRIAGLFVLGLLHIVFLYGGDILTTYAVVCLILLRMRAVRDRTALRVAAVLYGVVLLSVLAGALFLDPSSWLPSEAEARRNAEHATQALLGGWGDNISAHLAGLPLLLLQAVSLQGPTALAMMLLGLVAGRRYRLARVQGDEIWLRRIQVIGFPVGITGGVLYALGGGNSNSLAVVASVATAPLLSAAYVATLLRLMHRPRAVRLRAALAPAGRIALTNYLGQSAIGLLLFTGIGLGLAGAVSPPVTMALALLIFALQLVASSWWLRRYQCGPVEWLLRWVTNARRPVWRATGKGDGRGNP